MSRWSSGWSRAVTNNAVPRSFLHLEVVSTLLQLLNLLALELHPIVQWVLTEVERGHMIPFACESGRARKRGTHENW